MKGVHGVFAGSGSYHAVPGAQRNDFTNKGGVSTMQTNHVLLAGILVSALQLRSP